MAPVSVVARGEMVERVARAGMLEEPRHIVQVERDVGHVLKGVPDDDIGFTDAGDDGVGHIPQSRIFVVSLASHHPERLAHTLRQTFDEPLYLASPRAIPQGLQAFPSRGEPVCRGREALATFAVQFHRRARQNGVYLSLNGLYINTVEIMDAAR